MKTVTIICDGCGNDLTSTGNCIDWRLALLNQQKPSRSGAVTAMMIYPAIDHDCYFCGIPCLAKWAKEQWPKYFPSDRINVPTVQEGKNG